MDYKKVELKLSQKHPWNEIIINDLAEIGFESFTEEGDGIQAYIPAASFRADDLIKIVKDVNDHQVEVKYKVEDIPSQNWNQLWESDFDPVSVDNKLIIYAPFHDVDLSKYTYSVEIQPQMSFGTGHHQTTYLLSKALLNSEVQNKTILDVGTGTGVLGILVSKMGGKSVFGTDIEEGAYNNALENINRNNIGNFEVKLGDVNVIPEDKYDLIIANINKNVLIKHLPEYAKRADSGTILMLSGFFETDVASLQDEAKKVNFKLIETLTHETWAVMILIKE